MAELLSRTGQWAEAKGLYQRAIKNIELDRGTSHQDLGSTLIDYAKLLFDMGDFEAAQNAASRAHDILEKNLHPDDMRIAASLTQLGRLSLQKGEPGAAKPLFERALKIRQNQNRPRPQQVAVNLQLLGITHQRLDEPAAAMKFFQQALQLRERFLGPEHPQLAGNLTRLASLAERKQDFATAKPLYERALSIARKSAIPEEHLRAAFALAQLDERQNRLLEALERYRETIGVLEALSGQFEEDAARERYLQAGDKWQVYDALARLLLRLHEQDGNKGYDREAWAVIEAKRNRVVSEIITASGAKIQDAQLRQEIEKVHEAKSEAIVLEKALAEEQTKPVTEQATSRLENLTTLLAQTKSDYLKQVQAFLSQYPQYRTRFVDQQTIDPKALAKFADRLPTGTLAVQLFSSPDALYLFVVAPGGHFQVKRQAVAQPELYKLIREYRDYLERGATERLSWAPTTARRTTGAISFRSKSLRKNSALICWDRSKRS
ncbi:MAG: tetratricopeptide repeat protein [Candidatus Binatia bacterium]